MINAWINSGKPVSYLVKATDWKTKPFSKTKTIKTGIQISEKHFARIQQGLCPMQMEDKWFIYYNDGYLHFHRSWTGAKIYEAQIQKSDSVYIISEFTVERDTEIYSAIDDDEDARSLYFLIGRGLLGLNTEPPV